MCAIDPTVPCEGCSCSLTQPHLAKAKDGAIQAGQHARHSIGGTRAIHILLTGSVQHAVELKRQRLVSEDAAADAVVAVC